MLEEENANRRSTACANRQNQELWPVWVEVRVGKPLRQLENGDWVVKVTLVESGDEAEYRLTNIYDDPEAE